MAWWERPLARLRGGRTPNAPTGAAPAVASVPAAGEWNDVPRLQRVLAGPITPVAINDDFRDSLASFSDPSLLAPLSHRVDPSVGGLVEGLAAPGRPHLHDGPELVVPRSAPAAPTVQRRTTWGLDASALAVVPLEYRHPVARVVDAADPAAAPSFADAAQPDAEPVEAVGAAPQAAPPEPSELLVDAEPDAPLVADAAAAPDAGPITETTPGPAASDLPVAHRHAAASVTGTPAVQRTVGPGNPPVGTPVEAATEPAAVPVQRSRAEQPSVQRAAGPGHPALPVVSGGASREPSPAARPGVVPPMIPAAMPGPSTAAPVVQRLDAPGSEALPTPITAQRETDGADAVPDEPGFTEVPLIVAPAPGGPDAEAGSPGTPDGVDRASRPLIGEHAASRSQSLPAERPVVQSLPAARDLPVAAHPPAPQSTRDAPVLQRFPADRPPTQSGPAGADVPVPAGIPSTVEPLDRPLLRQQAPVVQRLDTELSGWAREDGPAGGRSATEVPLPIPSAPAAPTGPVGRADPAGSPADERFGSADERFLPPAVLAPPIAAVQRRASGTAPQPLAASEPSAGRAPGVQRVTAEAPAGPPPQPPLMLVRSPAGRASGTGPAPGEGMSFAAMFGGFATEGSGYGGTDVQRQAEAEPAAEPVEPAPPEPVAATAAPTATGAAAAAGAAAGGGNLDELARRLYEPLAARLREELWLDRERAGWMTELA